MRFGRERESPGSGYQTDRPTNRGIDFRPCGAFAARTRATTNDAKRQRLSTTAANSAAVRSCSLPGIINFGVSALIWINGVALKLG